MINFIAETPFITLLIYALLILFQLMQWVVAIVELHMGEYTKRSIFLVRMFPGYFFVVTARFLWQTFENYMMLE